MLYRAVKLPLCLSAHWRAIKNLGCVSEAVCCTGSKRIGAWQLTTSVNKEAGGAGSTSAAEYSAIDKRPLTPGRVPGVFFVIHEISITPPVCPVCRARVITSLAITRYNYSRPISRNFDRGGARARAPAIRLMENQLASTSFHRRMGNESHTRRNVNFQGAAKLSVIDSFRSSFPLVKQPHPNSPKFAAASAFPPLSTFRFRYKAPPWLSFEPAFGQKFLNSRFRLQLRLLFG